MTYFCNGIFLLPCLKLRRCDVFADARWHFNKGAAPPPNHLSDLSQKRSVQILQNFTAGNLSYFVETYFSGQKKVWFAWFCWCYFLPLIFSQFQFKRLEVLCKRTGRVKRIALPLHEVIVVASLWMGWGKPLQEVAAIRGLRAPINLHQPQYCSAQLGPNKSSPPESATILHLQLPSGYLCCPGFEKYFCRIFDNHQVHNMGTAPK